MKLSAGKQAGWCTPPDARAGSGARQGTNLKRCTRICSIRFSLVHALILLRVSRKDSSHTTPGGYRKTQDSDRTVNRWLPGSCSALISSRRSASAMLWPPHCGARPRTPVSLRDFACVSLVSGFLCFRLSGTGAGGRRRNCCSPNSSGCSAQKLYTACKIEHLFPSRNMSYETAYSRGLHMCFRLADTCEI